MTADELLRQEHTAETYRWTIDQCLRAQRRAQRRYAALLLIASIIGWRLGAPRDPDR